MNEEIILNGLHKFDFYNKLKGIENTNILIIGMQNSGKTTLVNHILNVNKCEGLYISGNDPNYNKLINNVKKINNKEKSYLVIDDIFMIDCISKKKIINNLFINKRFRPFIFTNNITFKFNNKDLVNNYVDYIFLSIEKIENNIKRLFSYYGSKFNSYESCYQLFNSFIMNNDYLWIVIDNKENNIYYYNFNIE